MEKMLVETIVDSQQLMELYLNSLLVNTALIQTSAELDAVTQDLAVIADTKLLLSEPDTLNIEANKIDPLVQMLFFNLGAITVAAPTLGIHRVILLEDYRNKITRLPKVEMFTHGLVSVQHRNFELVDISSLIVSPGQANKPVLTLDDCRYLLLVSETMQAIMCQEIADFKQIPLSKVKKLQKPYPYHWHIGTNLSDMVPIIDLTKLTRAVLANKC